MKSLDMSHHAWLHSLMSYRIMTEKHSQALHKAATEACEMPYRASDYKEFMKRVADAVGVVGLDIRNTIDETKGTKLVGILNTKGDAVSQMATTFTPHEITFIKVMIGKIITAPYQAYCIGSKEAMEVASQLSPPIIPSKAEGVCDRLIKNGWFRLSRPGRYSLTPRSLLELHEYLQSTYKDYVITCVDCKEVMTNGSACSTASCDVRVHRHCLLRWEGGLQTNEEGLKVCKSCEKPWVQAPVGESVLSANNAEVRKSRGRVTRRMNLAAEEEDEAEDEEEEEEEDREDEGQEEEEEEEVEESMGNNRKRRERSEDDEEDIKPNRRRSSRR